MINTDAFRLLLMIDKHNTHGFEFTYMSIKIRSRIGGLLLICVLINPTQTTKYVAKEIFIMNETKEIKKEDLIKQFELLKKSSDESYKNQDYNSLAKLTMSMVELYKIIMTY